MRPRAPHWSLQIRLLAASIREHGLRKPIVVTEDDWIVSGHRRHTAAKLAGLHRVRCRIEPIRRLDDMDRFVLLLREYNRQRDKTVTEKLREELINVNPDEAYDALIAHRAARRRHSDDGIAIEGEKVRSEITAAKKPMLDAVFKIIEERTGHWPLSVRQIHYALLNDLPLRDHRGERHSVLDCQTGCG